MKDEKTSRLFFQPGRRKSKTMNSDAKKRYLQNNKTNNRSVIGVSALFGNGIGLTPEELIVWGSDIETGPNETILVNLGCCRPQKKKSEEVKTKLQREHRWHFPTTIMNLS